MSNERWETTVHDKRTGQPVGGCDGDAIRRAEAAEARVRELEIQLREDHADGFGWKPRAEAAEAEVQRLQEEIESYKAYGDEAWAWIDEFCELSGQTDVFKLRAALNPEEGE